MQKSIRCKYKPLLWIILFAMQNTSASSFGSMSSSARLRALGALFNPSAPYLLPTSGMQLEPGIEAELACTCAFFPGQEIFCQFTPVWQAKRAEKVLYSNFGYRKNFVIAQFGTHFFADCGVLASDASFRGRWGFGMEWIFLKKHRWSLTTTGYGWKKTNTQSNPEIKSVEGLYAFQARINSSQYLASLQYFLHDAALLHPAGKLYNRPIKASLRAHIPLISVGSISQFSLLLEPSYLVATKGNGSDLSLKLGLQLSLGKENTFLLSTGCLRSLIYPTACTRPVSSVQIIDRHTAYTVYPAFHTESSDHSPLENRATPHTFSTVPVETVQKLQDFWDNNEFIWYQTSDQGTRKVVGEGPVLLKEDIDKGPISVTVNLNQQNAADIISTTYTPEEPVVTQHVGGEDYHTGNLLTIYSGITIEPTKPTEYNLLPLMVQKMRDTIPDRDVLLGYNAEKIIAVQNEDGEVELQNWTPRTIINPILEINAEHYCVFETTLQPYQTLVVSRTPKKIQSLNFVDPSPSGKWTITEFENLEAPSKFEAEQTADGERIQMTPEHIANFNAILCTYKRILNRFDLCAHFFGVVNQAIPSLGALVPDETDPYHLLRPEGRTGYALHGYKTMMALCWRSLIGAFQNGYATGTAYLSDAREGKICTVRLIDYRLTEPVIFDTLAHEMNHTYSYNHHGGLTYGWTDELQQYLDTYYVPEGLIPRKEDPVPGTRAAETQRYFATYSWPDMTHVEVQFYALDKDAPPLTRFLILSWDESYLPAPGNKYIPTFDHQDQKPFYTGEAAVEDYSQMPFIEQINNNCLRIGLRQPRISHGSSIVFLASAASAPPYTLDDSLSLIIYPRMRKLLIPAMDFSSFPWAADEHSGPPHPWDMSSYDAIYMELSEEGYRSLFLDSGNTGHVGRVAEEGLDYLTLSPDQGFLPHSKYYKTFSIQSAQEQAKALGYAGLGTYPAKPSTQLMSKFATQLMYMPRAVGLDPTTQTPCIVEYESGGKATQLRENDTATLIFLKQ